MFENSEALNGADANCPLSVRDLTVAYHRKPVIWDVDLDLPAGKLIGLVGPNGAGKSTLLKAAMELIPSTSGRVRFLGGPTPSRDIVSATFPSANRWTGIFRSAHSMS